MSDKPCEKKTQTIKRTATNLVVGIIFIVLGLLAIFYWWPELISLVKAGSGLLLITVGAILIIIAKT
ncbi:MAG: hypothetical protein K9L86_06540 [Candidatus Omnitrophica bacterium]|nr:hypothetical protein [Candidatus Omnitrophota bacterium]